MCGTLAEAGCDPTRVTTDVPWAALRREARKRFGVERFRSQSYFARGRYPNAAEMDRMLSLVSENQPRSAKEIAAEAEVGQRHAQVTLAMLREAKLVKRKRAGYVRKPQVVLSVEQLYRLIKASQERAQQGHVRLDEMMGYAESTECRRQMLREYFGETKGERCGICDNCVNHAGEVEHVAAASLLERSGARRIEVPGGAYFTTAPQMRPQVLETRFAVGATVSHPKFDAAWSLRYPGTR